VVLADLGGYPAHVIMREGPVAPWRQVFDLYRQRIESGELPPGSRLPSIRGMSQEFGIAGTTAQKVLGALKADGLVVTSPGTGTAGPVRHPAAVAEDT
jgi:DNA-binding GntR family transcriptional regulator